MSFGRLAITLAPVATGTVILALFSVRNIDARTRMLLQVIAWLGSIATAIGLITSGPELLDAFFEMQPRLKRLFNEFKTLSIGVQRALIAGVLFLFVSVVAYAAWVHPKLRPAVVFGVAAICIAGATYQITNVIRESNVREYIALGDEHLKRNRYTEAVVVYTKAIDLDASARNYRARANVFWQQNRIDRAVEDLSKVTAGPEATAEDHRLYGWGLQIEKRLDESLIAYTRAIELDGTSGHYFHRGRVLSQLGRHDEAVKDFTRSIEARNGEGGGCIFYSRASSYLSLGRKDEAINDMKKVVANNQKNDWCYKFAIRGLQNLGVNVEGR